MRGMDIRGSKYVSVISYHTLDHVRSLCTEMFDRVEDIHQSFCLYSFNGCAQSTEGTSAANTSTKETRKVYHWL